MIDMRHKPYHLPQVSAPFQSIIETLDEEGVSYDQLTLNPHLLKPSQGLVFGDNIQTKDVDNMSPIWVSKDLNILDGHHRWANSMANEVPIKLVRINLNQKDAARLLNKMQDIFEYQQQIKMEEVVAQDQLNAENDIDSGVSSNEFLATLEHDTPPTDDDRFLLQDVKEGNKEKLTGYRKNEVNEKSRIGNFFLLEPKEGFEKYEIEFDNLLDTHNLDLNFRNNVSPVEVLCNVWFPHVNFKKLSEKHNIPVESLINRAVTEKAKSLGFDGIKYGKSLVQGLK